MNFRPSHNCCGFFSLLFGVEFVCLMALVACLSSIAICSSDRAIRMLTVSISPEIQLIAAAWSFLGIPVVLVAGVGALWRIETSLRLFFWYLAISFFGCMIVPFKYVFNGSMCDAAIDPSVQQMGSSFVCGFTDTFAIFFILMAGLVHMYMIYIVWSAAEDVANTPCPELMRYSDDLSGILRPPPHKVPYPVGRGATPVPQPGGLMDDGHRGGLGLAVHGYPVEPQYRSFHPTRPLVEVGRMNRGAPMQGRPVTNQMDAAMPKYPLPTKEERPGAAMYKNQLPRHPDSMTGP